MAESKFRPLLKITHQLRERRLEEEALAASNPHLMAALTANKRRGQKLAIQARWAAIAVIALLLPIINPTWSVLYYEVILIGFALLGWAELNAAKVGRSRMELFLLFCDLVLLTFICLVPNPFSGVDWPTAMQYRFDNFYYFYVFLAGATLAYSWRTIFAVGAFTAGLWALGLLAVSIVGRQIPELSEKVRVGLADYPLLFNFMDPNNLGFNLRIQEIVVFLIVTGILALNGWRNNQLLLKQAEISRERGNLARHFPPNIVEQIAAQDQPFDQVRSQSVAVMFADIVGFTHMAEQQTPEEVVAMLREYHQHMESAVFNNHGTLDKFLGDGIMASFGTPEPSLEDAANSVRCATEMLASVEKWNIDRKKLGKVPIKISIGIHYGEVILGDIGSKRRLEFATLGDTVNVASRLEELTRSLDTQLVISNSVIEAAGGKTKGISGELLSDIQPAGQQVLRGRVHEIEIWKLVA
jgi:adenylate cyclase